MGHLAFRTRSAYACAMTRVAAVASYRYPHSVGIG